jgi:hypothetical protein
MFEKIKPNKKDAGVFALLYRAAQKKFLMAMRMFSKEKVELTALPKSNDTKIEAIGLPGSVWNYGCSISAAESIAAGYDRPKVKIPIKEDNLPLAASHKEVKGKITQSTIEDYWVDYNDAAPDPYSDE